MNAIFASKLYKSSNRKQKIVAAIQNSVNAELVQQLREYLAEPEDVSDALNEKSETKTRSDVRPEGVASPQADTSDRIRPSSSGVSHTSEFATEVSLEPDTSDTEVTDETQTEDIPLDKFHTPAGKKDEDKEKSEDEDTESDATVQESTSIKGATTLYAEPVKNSCCDQIRIDAEVIKGTLNLRDDTAGVSRIQIKDNEFWIYYQDKINLNSVMEPVINVLNASGFTRLEFNRLARTANAIVFEMSCIPDVVEPIAVK